MDKNPTGKMCQALALAGVTAMAMGCSVGDEPDPRQLAAQLAAAAPTFDAHALTPETVVDHLAGPPSNAASIMRAAPMAETAPLERTEQPAPDTQLVMLGENAQASIDDRLQQAAAVSLPERNHRFVACTDREVIEMLMLGRADFGLIGGSLSARETHAGLRQTTLGVELFALMVPVRSPARSLTRTQVRQIFTAEVTDWQQLGFASCAIVPVIPDDRSLAGRAEHTMIRGDAFAASCLSAKDDRSVAHRLAQHPGAIAIVRVTAGQVRPGHKLLQIDWAPPTAEAFGYGTYPFGMPLQLITSGEPDEAARAFVGFAQTEGRDLLGRTLTFLR